MNENIMKHEDILPADFDGVFRFTNWTDEEFVGIWGKKEYHFPPLTTAPMIMPEFSPLEIQNIRKKFAKDLAEREFFKGQQYRVLHRQERNDDSSPRLNSIHQAGTYNLDQLTPFIQKALENLPVSKATVQEAQAENIEAKLSRNEDGELNTQAVDRKTSLKQKALNS